MIIHSVGERQVAAISSGCGGDEVLTRFWTATMPMYQKIADEQANEWKLDQVIKSPAVTGIRWQPGYNIKILWAEGVAGHVLFDGERYRFRKDVSFGVNLDDSFRLTKGQVSGMLEDTDIEINHHAVAVLLFMQEQKFTVHAQSFRSQALSLRLPLDRKQFTKDKLAKHMTEMLNAYHTARTQTPTGNATKGNKYLDTDAS
jgi:hypothetical protein